MPAALRMTRAHLRAFVLGVREFRLDMTTHIASLDLLRSYDRGREVAHVLTARRFDQAAW